MEKKTSKTSAKVAKNAGADPRAEKAATSRATPAPPPSRKKAAPVLLSGGNPQIPKAEGDAPVQAYIAAMPGWKHDVGRRLDGLIVSAVPDVQKAVKWNSPFYGLEGQGWFLNSTASRSTSRWRSSASLRPVPPGRSKQGTRYLRHPRGRRARRGPARLLGAAGQPPPGEVL
jgi:hypothetical protein